MVLAGRARPAGAFLDPAIKTFTGRARDNRICEVAPARWPIRWLDRRVKGGFGVMINDVLAGVFAALVRVSGLQLLG